MIPTSLRSRSALIPFILTIITMTLYTVRRPLLATYTSYSPPIPKDAEEPLRVIRKPPQPPAPPPLPEYFPLAAGAQSPADLPPVPSWNKPPSPHVPESTRLYIGFTRYWPLLQQVVVAYITAGWPPEDIYVVENTGTFDANKNGLLTSQNPFYLDYHRLTSIFGVNIITTPSLQTFAQLQNLYLSEAITNNLTHYFWAHMDTVPQSHEAAQPYKSLYASAVDVIRESFSPSYDLYDRWAVRFFSYDWLALVNVKNYIKVGGFDTMVGYYGTDCDMHGRIAMNGLEAPNADAGTVFDVGRSLDNLEVLYRRQKKANVVRRGTEDEKTVVEVGEHGKITIGASSNENNSTATIAAAAHPPNNNEDEKINNDNTSTPEENAHYLSSTEPDTLGGPGFTALQTLLESLADEKRKDPYRNSWQLKQTGGVGEPFYYDADGWEEALQLTIAAGVEVYERKWGHKGCDIQYLKDLKLGDQWGVERDGTWRCEKEGGKRRCKEMGVEDRVWC